MTNYSEAKQEISQQQQQIQEQKEKVTKARQRLEKGPSVKEQMAIRKSQKVSPKYRVQREQEKKKIEQSKKELKEYQKELEEAEGDVKKQKETIEKYQKEGYTISKTPEGGYQFSKKVATTRTVRSAPAPKVDYSAIDKQVAEKQSKINDLNKVISNYERIKSRLTNPTAKKAIQSAINKFKSARSSLYADINKLKRKIPSGASKQITTYNNITKVISNISNSRIGQTVAGQRLINILSTKAKEIAPTTEIQDALRLTAIGISPQYYEQTGQVTFPKYISKTTSITEPAVTYNIEDTPYEELVTLWKDRVQTIENKEKDYLKDQRNQEEEVSEEEEEEIITEEEKKEEGPPLAFVPTMKIDVEKIPGLYDPYANVPKFESAPPAPEEPIMTRLTRGTTATPEELEMTGKTAGKGEGMLEFLEPAIKPVADFIVKPIPPLKNEEFFLSTVENEPIYIGKGNKMSVLDAGFTYVNVNLPKIKTDVNAALEASRQNLNVIDEAINNIKANPNATWTIQTEKYRGPLTPIERMSSQEALTYYQNQKKQLKEDIKSLEDQQKKVKKAEKEGSILYTKEPNVVGEQVELMKEYMGGDPWQRVGGLAEWVTSGMTPRGLAEDPFSIPSTLQAIGGDVEGALRRKASIRAARFDPEYRDVSYEAMGLGPQAMGKFWGGAAGLIAAPVVIPQMAVKYARGKGDLTDILGRVGTGETFGPDVGMSIYEAGVGGKGQGLISVGASEAITLGKSPAWQEAQKDPWGTFWATAGEVAGAVVLGGGAEMMSAKTPKLYNIYSKYRPMSLAKGGVRQLYHGVKIPSATGAIRKGITQIPRAQQALERFTARGGVVTSKYAPGMTKYVTRPWKPAAKLGGVLDTPVMQRAIQWAEAGSQKLFTRTDVGIKPFIRNIPRYYNKLSGLSKAKLIQRLKTVESRIARVVERDSALQRKMISGKISKAEFNRLKQPVHKTYDLLLAEKAAIKARMEGPTIGRQIIEKGAVKPIGQKATLWAEGKYIPPRLRHLVLGRKYRPQEKEFMPETITGEQQYPSIQSWTEFTDEGLWKRGGMHGTTQRLKQYAIIENLGDTLEQTLKVSKTKPKLSTVFDTTNPVDDIVLSNLQRDLNLVYSGSKAMKLQSKLSLAKIKRFFRQEVDTDLMYVGGYRNTYNKVVQLADDLTKRTGKKYTVDKAMHEGTWTIKNPAGKRIIDVTSSESPAVSILGEGIETRVPLEPYIRNVQGVNVAGPRWLALNKVEVAALKGMKPAKDVTKAINDLKILTGKKYGELGVAKGDTLEGAVMIGRGAQEKFLEYLPYTGRRGTRVLGYATRMTPENPAQFQFFHQYPAGKMSRWPLGLTKKPTYETSLFRTGWKAKPRVYWDVSPGTLEPKYINMLKSAAEKGPAEYTAMLRFVQSELKLKGAPKPIRAPSYKLSEVIRKGGKAELEAGYPTAQVAMKTGYTPELGAAVEAPPLSSSRLARAWDAWGRGVGKVTGWRHYTVDVPTGRVIPYYLEEPVFTTSLPKGRSGYFQKRDLIKSEAATQPIKPQTDFLSYAEHHIKSPSDIAKELAYMESYAMTRYKPVGYKAIASRVPQYERERQPTRYYKPQEYYSPRYQAPRQEEYSLPREGYEPYEPEYVPPYEGERGYDYDYRYDYRPVEMPYREYPYPYQPSAKPPTTKPYPILGVEQKKKKQLKPKARQFEKGYKERKYFVPKAEEVVKLGPKWSLMKNKKSASKGSSVAYKPKFFSLNKSA